MQIEMEEGRNEAALFLMTMFTAAHRLFPEINM